MIFSWNLKEIFIIFQNNFHMWFDIFWIFPSSFQFKWFFSHKFVETLHFVWTIFFRWEHLYTQLASTFNYDNSMNANLIFFPYAFNLIHLKKKKFNFFTESKRNKAESMERIELTTTVWMATPKSVQILRLHELNTVFDWL